ncbi:TPA: hypothetical protein QCV86_003043 [Bacillus thuringiensis]|uniref:hypothetical protein n=1 Tax=Bacillus cereus group TaxID=86661 RepID=UPI0006579866|nr:MULTISPECIES: hypothetical protein [Bacillus cereus group]KLA37205.1 hypothetical protein B4158_5707 [Bacillus cereus]MBU0451066.1 hypothetical protein [Bacillus thuringiensis]MCC3981956.1 hypothetical protein [Bacillus thuringiensis serovar kurstaki]MCR6841017.1 hypothetical protein [Bacillus thuringiensis]MCU5013239.1 hypothetical protein [Bacillus cereus]
MKDMKSILEGIDLDNHIGEVTLDNGQKMKLPKLTTGKIIKLVTYIGVEGFSMWENIRSAMIQNDISTWAKAATILSSLEDEKIVAIQAILLGITPQEALKFSPEETLDIFIGYAENTDLGKLYSKIQKLVKTMFKKDLPDFATLMNQMFPVQQVEIQDQPGQSS